MAKCINDERALCGLPLLARYSVLGGVARAHSQEMMTLDYFAHESPTPRFHTPSARYLLAAQHQPRLLAENISRVSCRAILGHDDIVEQTVRRWLQQPLWASRQEVDRSHQGLMQSPGHRANILEPTVTHLGIGMMCGRGFLWVTQMFARL